MNMPVSGKFLDIVGSDPSNSKSAQLHVDIFNCGIDSSKPVGKIS